MPKLSKKQWLVLFGAAVLSVGVVFGVWAVVSGQFFFKTKADPEITPKEVKITNISDNSFSVSWYTDKSTTAFIKYGLAADKLDRVVSSPDSGVSQASEVHHFSLKALTPAALYYFKIASDEFEFGEGEVAFSQKTAPTVSQTPPPPDSVYGKVVGPGGVALTQASVVYLTLASATPISTLASLNGNWAVSLSNSRSRDLGSYAKYDEVSEPIEIFVRGPSGLTASLSVTKAESSPTKTITLGEVGIAKREEEKFTLQTPKPQLLATPTPATSVGKPTATPPAASAVTLDLPPTKSFTDPTPTLVGSAPPGVEISITIRSSHEIKGKVVANPDGTWTFTPTTPLEPGDHTVTLTYLDKDGKSVSQNYTFKVLGASSAAGASATPAATPTQLPDAGVAAPTLALLSLSFLLIGFSLFLGLIYP